MKLHHILLALAASTSLFVLPACDGGAENAGEKLDEAADDVGDAVEDVVD